MKSCIPTIHSTSLEGKMKMQTVGNKDADTQSAEVFTDVVSACVSFRVFVKPRSLQWLPAVPGHLVYKRYEILFLSASDTEWCWEEGEEADLKTEETRVRERMQSCKCHVQTQTPVSQCYFHPPLSKRVNSMLNVRFYFLSHGVQQFTRWRWRRKLTRKWLIETRRDLHNL